MAKLTDNNKSLLIADYHTGKFSQRELAKKYDVSLGTVSKLTKEVNPQNEHLVNAQITVLSAKAMIPPEQMNAIMNTAQEIVYNQGLVTNATQLNLVRMTQCISDNVKSEKINVGMGAQQFQMVELGSSDYLNLQSAIDKAAITLKVADRHAPKSDINITQGQQNNNTPEIVGYGVRVLDIEAIDIKEED